MTAAISFDELRDATGRDLGYGDWMVIDQPRIDLFADAIEDHQWIHVDPARAKHTPFGGTIAHGYLTLAAAGTRVSELLRVDGASSIINYGLDRVRFPAPVPSGSRIRTHATITEVIEVPNGLQVTARVTAEAESAERPVCVADVRIRYLR
ncbi:MaoC family dehydratase [Streptosporangium sp. CA-115845]|uniref:MaoC family dehydratase n=1 Tax=Streptosporangium sp. CA-115845 TaxID=3240071 RepID=UPI003D8F0909